jgi:hypothetical protein
MDRTYSVDEESNKYIQILVTNLNCNEESYIGEWH